MTKRAGDWMQTFTGRAFYPLDPRPEDVDPRDIAHALARICRFNGHCAFTYPVGQHCVLMAEIAPPPLKLWALLHDAAEAYVCDLPRPIKRNVLGYDLAEARVMMAIAARFGLVGPEPVAIKRLDRMMLAAERRVLFGEPPLPWVSVEDVEPAEVVIGLTNPVEVEHAYLSALEALT